MFDVIGCIDWLPCLELVLVNMGYELVVTEGHFKGQVEIIEMVMDAHKW